MKIPAAVRFRLLSVLTVWAVFCSVSHAQDGSWDGPDLYRSEFWSHVQVGGGLGLGFGNGYTDIAIAPSAIYNFNKYIAAGVGLNGNYVRYKDYSLTVDEYRSWIYGGSVIGLFMPIEQLQLSVELEQLRVNSRLETTESGTVHDDFWNTGLIVGAGYRTQNVTVGLRYNLLYDPDKTVYADSWMPFVRVYF